MKRLLLILAIAFPVFISCEKAPSSEESSRELQTLKELGVDVSGMKHIYTSNSFVVSSTANYSNSFGEVICVLKGNQYTFFIVNHIYGDNGESKELITNFSIPYEEKGSTTVDVGYGEKKTVDFAGVQTFLGLYDNGVTYLPIKDWYHEPIKDGTHLAGSIAEKTDNPRMVIHSSKGTKVFSVDEINDSGLLAPEYNGGVLYNGVGYSATGEKLFTFGSTLNQMFFRPMDTRSLLIDWNPISADEYLSVRFDLGSTKAQEGIVTCDGRLLSIKENEVVWYASNKVATAIREKGINLASNDRIDSVTPVSKQNGIFKYKVSGIQYSGTKLDFTIALDVNTQSVTIE